MIMDRLQYAPRYQNSSVRESQEPSSVCQCHGIIMSLCNGLPCFTGKMDTLSGPPTVLCTAFAASPLLAHGTEVKEGHT